MSELRLVIREADREWSGTVHGSLADRAIAALSADPATLAELETACGRFASPKARRALRANLALGSCDEPRDAGLVIIDLFARLVVVESTYSSPGATGHVCYHDGERATDIWLRYHLAEDWLFLPDRCGWRHTAEARRRERRERPLHDVRAIFYGRPMLDFVAREVFAAFTGRTPIAASQAAEISENSGPGVDRPITCDTLKQIHAAWLLTPREDLNGACPRDVALAQHAHISSDLEDQCQRWSLVGESPPPLDSSSFAFRLGGFGTHELVQYYDLVRTLLRSCWQQLVDLAKDQPGADRLEGLALGDFLTSEVARLEKVRDDWLETPDPEYHGRTPQSIIDRERARLPEEISGHDALVDPDCPCCQMLADMPGPTFWHLDGSAMDDDFAFDIYHRTREGWEAERRKWEEHHRRFEAEWSERLRLGVTECGGDNSGKAFVWTRSLSVGNDANVPIGIRLFGIGCRLAELIVDIRGDAAGPSGWPEARQFIDRLNRDFSNLREVLQTSEPSVVEALFDPVRDRFIESLAALASARRDLSPKCESLTGSLATILDPDPIYLESTEDGGFDAPF